MNLKNVEFKIVDFSDLEGKVVKNIKMDDEGDTQEITFEMNSGETYMMYHDQDCCEHVRVEEIIGGELKDLIGEQILSATESSNATDDVVIQSRTYTFYLIATINHTLTIRWLGESNGYYSESVSFAELVPKSKVN